MQSKPENRVSSIASEPLTETETKSKSGKPHKTNITSLEAIFANKISIKISNRSAPRKPNHYSNKLSETSLLTVERAVSTIDLVKKYSIHTS